MCSSDLLRAQLDAEKARKERAEAAMAKERAAASPVAAWLEADVRDLGEEDLKAFAAALAEVQAAVAARANQVLQDALNQGRAMAASRARPSGNNHAPPPPQQFLAYANNGYGFDQFGAGSSSSANNGDMDMQMQLQMMMAMPPQPGFAAAETELVLQRELFGFPGPY